MTERKAKGVSFGGKTFGQTRFERKEPDYKTMLYPNIDYAKSNLHGTKSKWHKPYEPPMTQKKLEQLEEQSIETASTASQSVISEVRDREHRDRGVGIAPE